MKTIAIVGAMPSEIADVRRMLKTPVIETSSGFEFYIYEFNGNRIITACSGIGKVNAAVCSQVLIDRYKVEMIINAGIAGGMDPSVNVCDIVIAESTMYHDLLPRMLDNYPPHCSLFKTAPELVRLAEEACVAEQIPCHKGKIVSGEQFISDSVLKAKIREDFSPMAVDMESAGFGHCAYLNNVPYVSIRCISDKADEEGEISFEQFEKIAAERVANVIMSILENF